MFYVAACLLFDRDNKLLIYLRDDKPEISFPNHWDLFGGILEDGETPEQALVREVKEEIGIDLPDFKKYRDYACTAANEAPNIKYVFYAKIDLLPGELKLLDVGQMIKSIDLADRYQYNFANILGSIINDFALWKGLD